ncbi:unnamed protein product [Pleuronectes platessa]|uniref:Uncharacterized protein n=1 Tax=Pleuronectes platessa TaxID=8262 RepID=A0A9N7UZ70_PLEPL|nr:unnamed protein product [Pleuronectes platessa]
MQRGGRIGRGRARGNGVELDEPQPSQDEEVYGIDDRDSGGVPDTQNGDVRGPTLADLTDIFRAHMDRQEVRDARLMEENARQEQHFKTLKAWNSFNQILRPKQRCYTGVLQLVPHQVASEFLRFCVL